MIAMSGLPDAVTPMCSTRSGNAAAVEDDPGRSSSSRGVIYEGAAPCTLMT